MRRDGPGRREGGREEGGRENEYGYVLSWTRTKTNSRPWMDSSQILFLPHHTGVGGALPPDRARDGEGARATIEGPFRTIYLVVPPAKFKKAEN